MKKYLYLLFILFHFIETYSQEVIFADYFDIKTNAPASTLVTGKLHLKRNKDVLTSAIPSGYSFEISSDPSGLFSLTSKRENIDKMIGLLVGEFRVKTGQSTPANETDYNLTIALKKGATTITTKNITIKVVNKTMWEHLEEYYAERTVTLSRLWGRTTLSDSEVQAMINEINANNGPITSLNDVFDDIPEKIDDLHNKWVEIASHIGALGYAYANTSSSFYQSSALREAIYKSARAYMDNVPVFGDDINNPSGTYIGDGYQGLYQNIHNGKRRLSYGHVTHQWTIGDPLGAPLVQVMKELLVDIENGNSDAIALRESFLRFYQYFFSIVQGKRVMDDPDSNWGDISDPNYSNGAWTDANIHHRMRTLMVMGILWADYNRPITYVPYWYDDYNDGTALEGVTFGKNWSPSGVIKDLRNWCGKFSTPTYLYGQSGFHPDGTMTHHLPHGASDVAMRAYGFEWAQEVNNCIRFFENTPWPMENSDYQFFSDRIDYTYRKILYKQYLDYVVAGRSYYSPLAEFTTKNIKTAINELIAGKGPTTVITNETELIDLNNNLQNNTHQHSESVAFWNADYLVHRRENSEGNFYFSVKQKSLRTAGAEDFESIRKTWHAGSGVFQLKVDGQEYSQSVLKGYDWHTLPGVTEEWRTDAMPTGSASDAGPGLNYFSGVLADGTNATSAFIYIPTPIKVPTSGTKLDQLPQYASAEAYKSYHMIEKFGTAIGTNIARHDPGQNKNIVTCIDQSRHDSTISYSVDGGSIQSIAANSNADLTINMTGPTWVFHQNKGYLIFPEINQNLFIKTGSHINVTDTTVSFPVSNFIIALDHGINPTAASNKYHYVLVANATQAEMPGLLTEYSAHYFINREPGISHVAFDTDKKVAEASFFTASTAYLNEDESDWIKVNKPAIVIREELEGAVKISFTDPLHDLNSTSIEIEIPNNLTPGVYYYNIKGIELITGETATVSSTVNGSKVVINLPDGSDGPYYNYKEAVLAGAPISVSIPIDTLSIDKPLPKNNNVKIYPVPVTNETVITTLDDSKIHKLECHNLLGQLIYEVELTIPKNNINLGNQGLFSKKPQPMLLKVYTEKGIYVKMII